MAAKHKGCVVGYFKRRPGHLYYVTSSGQLVEKKMKHAKDAKSSCASGKSLGLSATKKAKRSRPKRAASRKRKIGFAAMPKTELRRIAAKGGRKAQRMRGGKGHKRIKKGSAVWKKHMAAFRKRR